MALGALYERFLAQQEAERQYAEQAALAARGQSTRGWFVPDGEWSGDPFDLPGIAYAFDRVAIAEAYQDFFFSPAGTVGDCLAAKLQSDYLAAQERAYRLRHLTPVRAAAHAATRLRGHADAGAGVFARLSSFLQDVLVAGSTGLPSGDYS